MTAEGTASLFLGFADRVTWTRLVAGEGHEENLRNFALKFRTAVQRSRSIVEVEVDELLANLNVLSTWHERATVVWDPPLKTLAEDSAKAARSVARTLQSDGAEPMEIDPESVATMLGEQWIGELTDFQRRDIAKLLSLKHGANFSVPGAGKTRVGLATFQGFHQAGEVERLLIVAPKSAYDSWQYENAVCLEVPLRMGIVGQPSVRGNDALIVNYERLDNSLEQLGRWITERPTMLLLDEAHRMKAGASGIYGSACLALGPRARRRLVLTGTPAPNSAKDLENLFGFVWPGYGRRQVVQAVAGGNLAQASKALKPLFVRTTKRELKLPPVTPQIVRVPVPPLHQEIYDALIGQYTARASAAEADFQRLGSTVVYLLMAATSPALLSVGTTKYDPLPYQVPPLPVHEGSSLLDLMRDLPVYEMSPKYQETLAIVAANAKQGRKTLVWSTFVRSLLTLERLLGEFHPAVVHGGTEDRAAEIDRFRNDPDCYVLLSNPATLGEGISLHHECHDAVYVDRDFAAGKFMQSLDRIHRLGLAPDTETRITVLSAEGTIDEVVNQRLGDKVSFMGAILDDPAVQELADLDEAPSVGGGLDARDLAALMGYLHARAA
ncbi:DEAD/DEAH box helicase [Nocardia sp. NPDC058518]|uniref:DEAD/DEAH box helicase n=1 Tax=Nocardia sp. NPDC058518 TaxID=3346534 RepID=UPI00364E6972